MCTPQRPQYRAGRPPSANRNPASRRALYDSQAFERTRSIAEALAQLQVTLEHLEMDMVLERVQRRHIRTKGPTELAYDEAVAVGWLRPVAQAPDEVLIQGNAEFTELDRFDPQFRPLFNLYVARLRRDRQNQQLLDLCLLALDLLLLVVPLLRVGRVAASIAAQARVVRWLERLVQMTRRLRRVLSGASDLDRARRIAMRLYAVRQRTGGRIVVNIGGTGETAGAINVNPNVAAPRTNIPDHVPAAAEDLAELFPRNALDEITSNSLPPDTLAWDRVIPGAHQTLKPGGRIVIRFTGGQGAVDGPIIRRELERLQFRDIVDWADGSVIEAVRGP